MEKKRIIHPAWALACKRKGTELCLIKGKYYLYEATSKWNPEKNRYNFNTSVVSYLSIT